MGRAALSGSAAATPQRSEARVELATDGIRRRSLTAALAREGLEPASGGPVDAVVVVLASADDDGCEAVAAARARGGGAAVVAVVAAPAQDAIRRLLDAGVDAVVDEAEAESTLASAVRAACAGQLALPRSYRDRFGRPALTRREKQVLGLVVMGLSNAEIARRLHLSQSTVKCHLTSSFAKLGARSRSEATALILDPVRGFGLGVLALTPRAEADRVG